MAELTWDLANRLGERFVLLGPTSVEDELGMQLPPMAYPDWLRQAMATPLPYHDASFSARVLRLHLDQTSDQASRRQAFIVEQVEWLNTKFSGTIGSVLHPMCGPGLFGQAFEAEGTTRSYHGCDIGPAAIQHARTHRFKRGFSYCLRDALTGCFCSEPHQLALLTYEALNAFPSEAAQNLLCRVADALLPGGIVYAEVRLLDGPHAGHQYGQRGYSLHHAGLFEDEPHLQLVQSLQSPTRDVVGHRFCVVRLRDRVARVFHSLVWVYGEPELKGLFERAGLDLFWQGRPFAFTCHQTETVNNLFLLARRL